MAGILGEIAAAKSLLIDLYNFTDRLKSAGADIEGIDLKLRNSQLLLRRYYEVLEGRLELLEDDEVNHLRQWFYTIKKLVRGCVKTLRRYERREMLGKLGWVLFGEEVAVIEKKVKEMLEGLMPWVLVLDTGLRNESASLLGQERRTGEAQGAALSTARHIGASCHEAQAKIERPRQFVIEGISCRNGRSFGPMYREQITFNDRTLPPVSCNFAESDRLGGGAFGTVFRASNNEQIALKRFSGVTAYENFTQELQALKALHFSGHSHILQSQFAGQQDGEFLILFPLAQGDLRSVLRQPPPPFEPRAEQWIVEQMAGLASAVKLIHSWHGSPPRDNGAQSSTKMLAHRDIKPENILVFQDLPDQSTLLKISDFGSARFYDLAAGVETQHSNSESAHKTDFSTGSYGTLMYAPPSPTVFDGAAGDMWALGCVFLEILAWYLRPPGHTALSFQQSRIRTIRSDQDESEEILSSSFWTTDAMMRPRLHPAVTELLDSIKQLAVRSEWLLDIPYHIERLLSLKSETRTTANDLSAVLQHGLKLKKLALGNDTTPFVVTNDESLLSEIEASHTAADCEQKEIDADTVATPKLLWQLQPALLSESPISNGQQTRVDSTPLRRRCRLEEVSLRQRFKSG